MDVRETLGDRAFKVFAPTLWNELPKDFLPNVNNVKVFKSKQHTHYFKLAYN